METYRERKQNVYRIYAKSYDDDRRLMLGDQALATRMTFVADTLSGVSVGIDLSQDMLVVAQHKIADCRLTYVVQTDVTQPLPFADETFDLVASLNLLQEVSAPTLVLEEVQRILKPGGSFRGATACYAGDNAAEMVHQAIARRHAWYFRPADEMLTLFQRVFPTGTGYFEPFARVARAQGAGAPTFTLFAEMLQKVRDLGQNPEDVRMGALFLEGKKG